jgi:hypothetical protein
MASALAFADRCQATAHVGSGVYLDDFDRHAGDARWLGLVECVFGTREETRQLLLIAVGVYGELLD